MTGFVLFCYAIAFACWLGIGFIITWNVGHGLRNF